MNVYTVWIWMNDWTQDAIFGIFQNSFEEERTEQVHFYYFWENKPSLLRNPSDVLLWCNIAVREATDSYFISLITYPFINIIEGCVVINYEYHQNTESYCSKVCTNLM